MTKSLFDLIGRDYLLWRVSYDALGWRIENIDSNFVVCISRRKALLIIDAMDRMIRGSPNLP